MRIKKVYFTNFNFETIIGVVFAVFFISKMIRSFSGSDEAGGIWNYIQIGIVLFGLVVLLSFIRKLITDVTLLSLLAFTAVTMINALMFLDFNMVGIYDFAMLAYPLFVFVIAYYISGRGEIEKNLLIKLVFYIISFIFIFNMIRAGIYSTAVGAVADVYFILGLYPLVLICSKNKFIPSLACGLSVLLSGKRLGIILFAFMAIVYFFYRSIQNKKLKQFFSLMVLAVLFAVVAIYIGENYNIYLWYRMKLMLYESDSSGREVLWRKVWSLLGNSNIVYIILGHGDGAVFERIGNHAHNDYLEIFYNYGFLPLFLYIVFYIRCIVELIGMFRHKYEHTVVFALVILFSISVSMFSFYYIMPTYVTCGMLCKGYILNDYRRKHMPDSPSLKLKRMSFV